jgi:hypothetical protein
MVDLFKKFWIKHKLENTAYQVTLPKSNLSSYQYYTGNATRIYTIEIYNNDGSTPVQIISDDGSGNLSATSTGILSSVTGENSTVDYTNNQITIYWDSTYLAGLTNNPYMKFKYISTDKENHVEMVDFLGEVFDYYKENELDVQLKYYNPEEIPVHLIDTLAQDHNWVIDRVFSEEEDYLRRQLKFLYDLYKSKRKRDSVYFSISVINRRVNLYNLLAKKGAYDDYSQYVIFDMKTLFDTLTNAAPGSDQEVVASQIQDIFDSLYNPSSEYYPTKHFLLDLSLDILNTDGDLLAAKDLATLKTYILRIKAKTQYPHLQSYLGLLADSTLTQQDGQVFQFKLTEGEQTYSINEFRALYRGPEQVYSIAQFANSAWVFLPLIMNNTYRMNSGLVFNMQIGDVENYLTSFKVGKDSYDTLTPYLGEIKDPFYTSNNMSIIYDDDYYYLTLKLDEDEGNDYPIKEVGVYNNQGKLSFYIKHPAIYKTDSHKHYYRLKLKVSGTL